MLWRFSRPHTVIGTALSVLGLYLVVVADLEAVALADGLVNVAWVLLAGCCVNVAIVGLNQIEDVEIDRVNKPHLPIAAGDLSLPAARRIVAVAVALPVGLALTQGWIETVAVVLALLVGVAYSSPPLRLKRRPVLAALSISGVRSVVVNLGIALHFTTALAATTALPDAVWALTLFVLPFSFAIAVLKDVPDLEGDRRFQIATFTVRLGPERVRALGLAALAVAYGGMALAGPFLVDGVQPVVLAVSHLAAFALLLHWARGVDPHDREAFTGFYLRVWALFFLEYLIVPAAALLA